MIKDYYKTLGVLQDASLADIKQAYRQLAHKYHPDKNKASNAAAIFIEITEAYEILRDDQRRAAYDALYNRYKSPEASPFKETETKQQEEWTEYGQQKGRQYSSMDYEKFIRVAVEELKIGVRYIPNLIFIGICLLGAVTLLNILPKAFSDRSAPAGAGIVFLLAALGMATLGYFLFKRMKTDYLKERKQTYKQPKP